MRRQRALVSVLICFALSGCSGDLLVDPLMRADAGGVDASEDVSVDTSGDRDVEADAEMDGGEDDARPDVSPDATNPLSPRASNASCRLPEAPNPGGFETENAYPSLSFDRPIWVGTAPGDDETVYVAEQAGAIYAFDDRSDVSERELVADVDASRANNEEGLLGLAFHPRFEENGRAFIHYSSARDCPSGFGRCGVISEVSRSAARRLDLSTERVLLRVGQPFGNHNGGDLHFGPDGNLYIALGDGGSGGDPMNHGQRTETLLGSILRIDVDDVPSGEQYGIPRGNPFAGGGGRPEIYAWGLRNPWRMRFDPATGDLYIGDVGQAEWEEVSRISEPGNLGWKIREGFECYRADSCSNDFVAPIHAYDHDQGESITGGLVYRGSALPELWGRYLFGDFVSGRVWMLSEADGDFEVSEVARTMNVASFGEDTQGEPLIATFRGEILELVRSEPPVGVEPFPQTLSETGCFADVASLEMAEGVIPYEVNQPFWSDGTDKLRHFALPDDGDVVVQPDGSYEFPLGTVFIKTFSVRQTGGGSRPIETRFYAKESRGWRGFTYAWNEAGTEGTLLAAGEERAVATADGSLDWTYPSSAQCDQCHTPAAGFVLGFETDQLERVALYDGEAFPQLPALAEAHITGLDLGSADPHPAIDDETASLEDRARSYLDINCAMCHQPTGPGNASFDARRSTPFEDTGLCNGEVTQDTLGVEDGRLIAPGDAARSLLHVRIDERGEGQMPPLASSVVDEAASDVLARWIDSLSECP